MSDPAAPSTPQMSIIIPVYRDWDRLSTLLTALEGQRENGPSFEVVVVANDDARHPPLHLPMDRFGYCHTPGSYAARNHGAGMARGSILVFTDADCVPQSGWIVAMAKAVGDGTIVAGDVQMVAGDPPNFWERFDQMTGIPQRAYVRRGYAATANFAVTRRTFDQVGGFPEDGFSGGDERFCRRAADLGVSVVFAPDAIVTHPSRDSWPALAQKVRRIKGGQLRAGPLRRRAYWAVRLFVPPVRQLLVIARAKGGVVDKLGAACAAFVFWGYGAYEAVRLTLGKRPQR